MKSWLASTKNLIADVREAYDLYRSKHYYSQFGEDIVIRSLLETRLRKSGPGFYVDVGAFAPRTASNTYLLYRQGWRGINIEPSPRGRRAFRWGRRRDINLQLAVSDTNGTATFHMQDVLRSGVNTLQADHATKWKARSAVPVIEVQVATRTLASVLDEYLPHGTTIDLLSVDAEGHDSNVLRSNDWERFRPTVVLVEDFASDVAGALSSTIGTYMDELGYSMHARTPPTSIYLDSKALHGG